MPRELRRATACLNCGAEVTRNFCAECGQENTDYRVSLRRLIGDLADELFQFESRLWRTFAVLFTRPGQLTLDYNAGRRVRYTTPLRLYVLASVAYFFVAGISARQESIVKVDFKDVTLSSGPDSNAFLQQLDRRLGAVQQDPQAASRRASQTLTDWAPRVMALLLPLFALLTLAFFRRPRLYYVEHLVFALHLHAVAFLLLVVHSVARHHTGWLLFPLLVVWLTVAVRRVFQQSWWRLAWKLPLVGVTYLFFVSMGVGFTTAVGMLLL